MGNSTTVEQRIADKTLARRERRRLEVEGFAEIIIPGAGFLFRGSIQDLSPTGCYIRSKAYLGAAPGAEVEVRFSVNELHFNALARVRVVRRGVGAGFVFLSVEKKLQTRLDELIARLRKPVTSVAAK